jgi:signal transduction histidine kinase
VRHEFDFQITDRFSTEMARTQGVDDALAHSVSALRANLEVAWAAITSGYRPGRLWLAEVEKPVCATLAVADGPPEDVLPGLPALTHSLENGDQPVGMILLGHRTTAEPLDDKDRRLIALLGQELTRTLSVHAHIENLEQVPGRILAAVDADRNRIAQDLHDSVLQFLGAIPLELDRAIRLADRDPAQVRTILDRAIDQAEIVSQETRASVYDLSPPLLLRHGVADAARAYAEQACARTGIQLHWSVDSESVWHRLPETQATQVYRIVQQAVDNALVHARPAALNVRFERGKEDLLVQVSDDGAGFDPASILLTSQASPGETGLGYISMQARAKALAGTLSVRSTPGAGTTITLRFPSV